jgi:hypothetical protein
LVLRRRVRQAAAPPSGFQAPLSARHPALRRDQRAVSWVRRQVALLREEFLPVAAPAAGPRGAAVAASGFAESLRAAQQAVAQQVVLPFAAVRVRILARVPAARRPVAELAVQVAWPDAERLPEASRAAAAQPAVSSFAAVRAPIPVHAPAAARRPAVELAAQVASPNAEEAVGAAQPDVAAAVEVAQPDAGVAEAAVQPGAVAEEAGAELAAAAVQEVPGGPAAEPPSGAAAWPSLPPFVAPPRLKPTVRAMGWSSVAWPTGQSWRAAQFSSLSCALGPGRSQKWCRGGNAGENKRKR